MPPQGLSIAYLCSLLVYLDTLSWWLCRQYVEGHHLIPAQFATSPVTVLDLSLVCTAARMWVGCLVFSCTDLGNALSLS